MKPMLTGCLWSTTENYGILTDMLTYAIILLILAMAIVVMEMLIPSGGLLSLFAIAAAVGSIWLAFKTSTATGYVFIAAVLVCLPTVIVVGLNILPRTPWGRRMFLIPKATAQSVSGTAGVAEEDYSDLLGKIGKAVSPLRPAGIAEIEGTRYSVVAAGQSIERSTEIVVTRIDGNSIVVEPNNDI